MSGYASLDQTVFDILIVFLIYLPTASFLNNDLTVLLYFDYKGVMCKGVVKLLIPEAPLKSRVETSSQGHSKIILVSDNATSSHAASFCMSTGL